MSEEIQLRRLVIKSYHITEVEFGEENTVSIDGKITINKSILKELNDFCGFEYYGSKHLENTLTKFIQMWWFYNRYGVDKRRSHLSSMIVSGQMTREEALEELKKPIYDETEMKSEISMLLKNLGISEAEFDEILKQKPKQHTDYKTDKITTIVNKIRLKE